MRLILASASPRRRELLEQVGIEYEVISSSVDEVTDAVLADKMVLSLSGQKARDVADRCQGEWVVIGADTIVSVEGEILGKPRCEGEAFEMLNKVQGRSHLVYTGVTIIKREKKREERVEFVVCTKVSIFAMSEEEIRGYIGTGESMDKAGAYGIQGKFAAYVEGIEGDYNNVVGLPIGRVCQELKKIMVGKM